MRIAGWVLLTVILWGAGTVQADTWPQPLPRSVFSASGARFVRIVPGTVGAGGSPARPATALLYGLQPDRSYGLAAEISLVHPSSPVTVLVSDSGAFLTLDNWHGFGTGKVAAIYGPTGSLVRSYELEELYPPDRLARIPRSVSSRHWRCEPVHFVEPQAQASVYVPEVLGGYFVFTLATGTVVHTAGARSTCSGPAGPLSWTWMGN
jgi:hypothetical protein